MGEAETVGDKRVILYPKNDSVANSLARFIGDEYILIFGEGGQFTVISKAIDCKAFVAHIRGSHDVKGGGNQIRGSFKGEISHDAILNTLKDFLG